MKLLVTGATGFVGRNVLLRALAESRYDEIWVPVRSRRRLTEQFEADGFASVPSRVRVVETSAPDWQLAGLPAVDHVVHCAGVIFARTWEEYRTVNVDGTVELFRRLPHPPAKTVVLSSQSAAGPCPDGTLEKCESDSDEPVTWYGKSKLEMEQRISAEFPQLNFLVLRPPMVFGPRDQATLPLFKMVRRGIFFKPGLRPKYYSYISVLDLTSAIFAALERDWSSLASRRYFVASEEPVSDTQLIRLTAQASNRRGVMLSVPQTLLKGISRVIDTVPTWRASIPSLSVDRAKEIWPDRWVVSSRAFQESFAWKPMEKLATTLRQTRDWYVKTGQLPA